MPTGTVPSGRGARPRRGLSSESSTRPARLAGGPDSKRPAEEVSASQKTRSGGVVEEVSGALHQCRTETDDDITGITNHVCQLCGVEGRQIQLRQIEVRQVDLRQIEVAQVDRGDLDVGKREHA